MPKRNYFAGSARRRTCGPFRAPARGEGRHRYAAAASARQKAALWASRKPWKPWEALIPLGLPGRATASSYAQP